MFWRRKSRSKRRSPRIAEEVVCLIKEMALSNRLWGAERIRYGASFDAVAKSADTKILRTPIQAPRATAVCERFLGNVRRECLDHVLTLSEQHLLVVLREDVVYFNEARPHQGIDQRIPCSPVNDNVAGKARVATRPTLGGLHHAYWRAA